MRKNSSRRVEKTARKVVRLRGAGKTVVLGVTGSIAAYKSAELASLLVKQGHNIFVVMTHDAAEFITQEIFRELNTLGAKANDAAISQRVVACKAELEKIREQIQNLE